MGEGAMNVQGKPKSRSVIRFFLTVGIPATFLFVIAVCIFFYYILLSLQKESNNLYSHYVQNVGQEFDNALTLLYKQSYRLKHDGEIVSYVSAAEKSSSQSIYSSYKIIQKFNALNSLYQYADNTFLYVRDSDSVIGNGSHNSSGLYYGENYGDTGISLEEWHAIISSGSANGIFWNYNPSANSMILVDSLGNLSGNIVTWVSMDPIEAQWLEALPDHSSVQIVSRKRNMVYSSEKDGDNVDYFARFDSEETVNCQKTVIGGRKFVLFSSRSAIYDWSYILAIPSNMIYQAPQMLAIMAIFMLAFLIYICLMSYHILHNNYHPLKRIVRLLGDSRVSESRETQNEYAVIESALLQMIQANEEISSVVIKQEKDLREYFLTGLLLGMSQQWSSRQWQEFATLFPNLKGPGILLSLTDCVQEDLVGSFYTAFLSLPSIQNAAGIYRVSVGSAIVFLLVGQEKGAVSQLEEDVDTLLRGVNEDNGSHMNCMINFCKDFQTQLAESYNEIVVMQKICDKTPDKFAYSYSCDKDDFKKVVQQNCSLSRQNELMELMDKGKWKEARYLVSSAVLKIVNSPIASAKEVANSMMFIVFSNAFERWGEEKGVTFTAILAGSADHLIKNILSADTVETLLESCNDCLRWFQDKRAEHDQYEQSKYDNSMISEICTYIQDNFKTRDLNVSMLADTFHLSLPYLSKLFKETTGYNVLEYICLARLNYAKSLLRSTTYSIQYIAQEAGFNDSKRLVQLLKKYEGVTPSEFRKQ